MFKCFLCMKLLAVNCLGVPVIHEEHHFLVEIEFI